MSGEKRTPLQIAQQDIRMLERQLNTMRQNQRDALRAAQQRSSAEIERLKRIQQERETRMDERIQSMSATLRLTRMQHQEEMRRQAESFTRMQRQQAASFERSQQAMYNQLAHAIEESNQYIQHVSQAHARQIGQLRDQVNRMALARQHNERSARELLSDVAKEWEVAQLLPCQKFCPERMKEIRVHLQGIQNYPPETQMSIAHIALKDLLLVEEETEKARFHYESLHVRTLQILDTTLQSLAFNRDNLSFEEVEGGRGERIDFDFWTEGKYQALENVLKNLRQNIVEGYHDPSFKQETLNEAYEIALQLNERLEQLTQEAIERGNASAMRASIAEKIACTLQSSHCYEIVDYGYEQQDARKSFLVKMHNANNDSDIVILIYPESLQKQQLILKTKSNGYISERDLYLRASEINEELKAVGITIEESPCEVNPGDDHSLDELYDIAAILQEKGNGLPPSVINNAKLRPRQQKMQFG